jgi:hypothetical protein
LNPLEQNAAFFSTRRRTRNGCVPRRKQIHAPDFSTSRNNRRLGLCRTTTDKRRNHDAESSSASRTGPVCLHRLQSRRQRRRRSHDRHERQSSKLQNHPLLVSVHYQRTRGRGAAVDVLSRGARWSTGGSEDGSHRQSQRSLNVSAEWRRSNSGSQPTRCRVLARRFHASFGVRFTANRFGEWRHRAAETQVRSNVTNVSWNYRVLQRDGEYASRFRLGSLPLCTPRSPRRGSSRSKRCARRHPSARCRN